MEQGEKSKIKEKWKGCEVMVTKLGYEIELTKTLAKTSMHKNSRPFISVSVRGTGYWYFLEPLRWSPTRYSDWGTTVLHGVWVGESSRHSQMDDHSGVTWKPYRRCPRGRFCSLWWQWLFCDLVTTETVTQTKECVTGRIAAKLILVNHRDLEGGKWFRCPEASIRMCSSSPRPPLLWPKGKKEKEGTKAKV